jgi:hypothetical protein
MNRRLLSCLLVLCVALRSLVPLVASAQADDSPVAAHCSDAGTDARQVAHNDTRATGTNPCPHCDHAGPSQSGCASHCIFPVALLSIVVTISIPHDALLFDAIALPAETRADIPPTPPPIG